MVNIYATLGRNEKLISGIYTHKHCRYVCGDRNQHKDSFGLLWTVGRWKETWDSRVAIITNHVDAACIRRSGQATRPEQCSGDG